MRLTLRTLLAYMSDVLEPADAQELQAKIERSSFARKLSERIPRLLEHRDLACPRVDSRSSGADPNTVAEYIDGLLAPERMAEFDRVCLDSDIRLAEVASCFQVLTRVLGKPAKIPQSMRDRVYELGHQRREQADEQPAHELSVQDRIAMSEEYVDAPVLKPAKSQFPAPGDELRAELMEKDDVDAEDEPQETMPADEGGSAEAVAPPPLVDSPGAEVSADEPLVETTSEPVELAAGADRDTKDVRIDAPRPGALRRFAPVAALVLSVVVLGIALVIALGPETIFGPSSKQTAEKTSDTDGEGSSADGDSDPTSGNSADSAGVANEDETQADAVGNDALANGPRSAQNDPLNLDPDGPAPAVDLAGSDGPDDAADQAGGNSGTNDETTDDRELINLTIPNGDEAAPVEPEFVVGGEPIGKIATSQQIIARRDEARGGWFRLPIDAPVLERDRLLSFPMFRPRLTIGENWSITIVGASGVEFNGIVEDKLNMALMFGSCTISSLGATNVETQLTAGDISGTVTLTDSDSMAAVRIQSYMSPGEDPLAGTRLIFVDIFAARGRVIWEDANNVSVLDEGQARRYQAGVLIESVTLSQMPTWPHVGVEGIDRMATEAVDEIVGADETLLREFRRLLNDQRVEVRTLAGQCLSLLGDHTVVLRALNDSRNKSYWKHYIEDLRDTMAQHPDMAMSVWQATQMVAGGDAETVFRLLSGYSEEQLEAGGADQLVDLLDDPSLTIRVLAIDNLRRVTGTHLMYRPDSAERIRSRYYERWQDKLLAGEIAYQEPPTPPAIAEE